MKQQVSLNICKEKFSVKYINSGFTLFFFSVNTEVGIGNSFLFFFFQLIKRKAIWYNPNGLPYIAGKPGKLIICISQIISLAY